MWAGGGVDLRAVAVAARRVGGVECMALLGIDPAKVARVQ
jgi:hypothetical protein